MTDKLEELRAEIDRTDAAITELLLRRMELSAQVGEYKRSHSLPVYVPEREAVIFSKLAERSGAFGEYTAEIYKTLLAQSREYQRRFPNGASCPAEVGRENGK